jgi:formate-dependent nitrite reductase cytochrome c552 subunit
MTYIKRAKEIHAAAADAKTYSENLKVAFPDLRQAGFVDDRADARHGHYPSTTVITLRQGLDLIGHGFNSLIELPPVTGKISDDAYHAW